jgi:hypothetical protein
MFDLKDLPHGVSSQQALAQVEAESRPRHNNNDKNKPIFSKAGVTSTVPTKTDASSTASAKPPSSANPVAAPVGHGTVLAQVPTGATSKNTPVSKPTGGIKKLNVAKKHLTVSLEGTSEGFYYYAQARWGHGGWGVKAVEGAHYLHYQAWLPECDYQHMLYLACTHQGFFGWRESDEGSMVEGSGVQVGRASTFTTPRSSGGGSSAAGEAFERGVEAVGEAVGEVSQAMGRAVDVVVEVFASARRDVVKGFDRFGAKLRRSGGSFNQKVEISLIELKVEAILGKTQVVKAAKGCYKALKGGVKTGLKGLKGMVMCGSSRMPVDE